MSISDLIFVQNFHTDHATQYVWWFPSKSATTETYTNFLKQIFQIQVPEKLLTDRNAAFTASKLLLLLLLLF